jgi:hypothetical protein
MGYSFEWRREMGVRETARASVAGAWYSLLNRDNRRQTIREKSLDRHSFATAMADAQAYLPVGRRGYFLRVDTWV